MSKTPRDKQPGESLDQALPDPNMKIDMMQTPWLIDRVKSSDAYAQNLYAAMCNVSWQLQEPWEILKGHTWSCSWRGAGGIIADMQGRGSYMDWYCSGISAGDGPDDPDVIAQGQILESRRYVSEATVTDEIRQDLARIGWCPIDEDQEEC